MSLQTVKFDEKNFRAMMQSLKRYNSAEYDDVVRGVAGAVFESAARKTKRTTAKKIRQNTKKKLSSTLRTPEGAKVALSKGGKFWYQGPGWPNKRWILVSDQGRITNVQGGTVQRTRGGGTIKQQSVDKRLQSQINKAAKWLKSYVAERNRKRIAAIGLGQRSFLMMMEALRIPISSTRGLSHALKVKVPSGARQSVRATQQGTGKEFKINYRSTMQAALNPHAKGMGAFAWALRGQVSAFKRNAKKDVVKYAKGFAARRGFSVRS